jgi:5'-3' exonuclease
LTKQNWYAKVGNGMLITYKKKNTLHPSRKPALETLKNGTNKPQFMNSNNTKPVIVFDVNENIIRHGTVEE